MSGIWDRIKGILGWVKREPDKKEDDRVMYIIAGLGNPTREYEKTRHNVGFEVIDVLAARASLFADAQLPHIQADIIIYDNDMFRIHFIEIRGSPYALAAEVHEGLGF